MASKPSLNTITDEDWHRIQQRAAAAHPTLADGTHPQAAEMRRQADQQYQQRHNN